MPTPSLPATLLEPNSVPSFDTAGKFLLMLQSLKRVLAIEPENGELHSMIVDFMLTC